MLDLLARHSRIDITVKADGDLHVDHHHTTEDVGIALAGRETGARHDGGHHPLRLDPLPMDETLSRVVIDIWAGRFWFQGRIPARQGWPVDSELVREWFNAFTHQRRARLCMLKTLHGATAIISPNSGSGSARPTLVRRLRSIRAPRAKAPSHQGSSSAVDLPFVLSSRRRSHYVDGAAHL